ncbi:MAG: FtsX-like permease family protein [Lentisphaeria bacterium]|nr:FtsX-like permease family protein [Lentisphaeria bacterium]
MHKSFLTFFIYISIALQSFAFDKDLWQNTFNKLTTAEHRLPGSQEAKQAATYLEKSLKEMGYEVHVQEFQIPELINKRCEMVLGDKSIELYPMRPNGIITPVTGEAGLTGTLIDATGDRLDQMETLPADAIVVLNYNSYQQWINVFRLGANAVIFLKQEDMQAIHSHYSPANFNYPRFYYQGKKQDLPFGEKVTIHANVTWKKALGRNIIAIKKGSAPSIASKGEELVVLSADYDSWGEVPHLSQGARKAANTASLLTIAESYSKQDLNRHVVFAFLDASSQLHQGATKFYRLIDPSRKGDNTAVKLERKSYDNEIEFLNQIFELMAMEEPWHHRENAVHQDLMLQLKRWSKVELYYLKKELKDLRLALNLQQKEIKRLFEVGPQNPQEKALKADYEKRWAARKAYLKTLDPSDDNYKTVAKELSYGYPLASYSAAQKQRFDELEAERMKWNDILRGLSKIIKDGSYKLEVNLVPMAQKSLEVTKQKLNARKTELEWFHKNLTTEEKIYDFIHDKYINFHMSLYLGDQLKRWGVAIGGKAALRSSKDIQGLYTTFLSAINKISESMELQYFEQATTNLSLTSEDLIIGRTQWTHSGEVAGLVQIPNFVFATVQDRHHREGTPGDTHEFLNADNVLAQTEEIMKLLNKVIVSDTISLNRSFSHNSIQFIPGFTSSNKPTGIFVMAPLTSPIPNLPMAGAIVQLRAKGDPINFGYNQDKIPGFNNYQVLITNENGTYQYGPYPLGRWHSIHHRGFGGIFNQYGELEMGSNSLFEKQANQRLNINYVNSSAVPSSPQLAVKESSVMIGRSNGTLSDTDSFFKTKDGIVLWHAKESVKTAKVFGVDGAVILNTGSISLEDANEGKETARDFSEKNGIPSNSKNFHNVNRQAAVDIYRMNEARLDILRSKGIMDNSIETLHGQTQDLVLDIDRKELPVLEADANAYSAFKGQAFLHEKILSIMNDLVTAVIVLLALSVPFAFVLERLLIGASTIHKQLAGIAVFFCLTFLALYFSHPAFAISSAPMIIFLGFTIITLSGMVIVILMQKFEKELKALQGMETSLHAAEVSHFTTIMAAMSMGISSMRRRPLRTTLTAVTIILLTFTILCFASFGSSTEVVTTFKQPSPSYSGVFVHQYNWKPLDENFKTMTQKRFPDAQITSRYWLTSQFGQKENILLTAANGENLLQMKGIIGFDEKELSYRKDLKELFTETADFNNAIWLTSAVANRLSLKVGDSVILNGRKLQFAGIVDSVQLTVITDMDESSILPVDFSGENTTTIGADTEDETRDAASWETIGADATAFVSRDVAKELGGQLYSFTVYTAAVDKAIQAAESIAIYMQMPISATRNDGVYIHRLGTAYAASGVEDLFFPILLGGLVIFGTMLGSVADRQKEIYTFSALGLAPVHVSGLFFAEALTFSIIGGLSGYLLAQVSLKVLLVVASYGLITVPEMNFSSTNAIITIILVMLTVIISSIYPALKASKSANPGVDRSWKLSKPNGDLWEIIFPFTVSDYDITGVVSFLKEHFGNYADTGLGSFTARDTELFMKDGRVAIKSVLALAPFDLGVTQEFELYSVASEIEGIDEVAIKLVRRSGQPKDWQRLNKVLLDELRKQFLLWRALPSESVEHYRNETLIYIESLKQEA